MGGSIRLSMSVKLFLLKSGEYVISEAKELVSGENPCGYLFENPCRVIINSPMFTVTEEDENSSVQVSLSPWIILSSDNNVAIPTDWVVTVVEPIDNVTKMYEEQVNGKINKDSSFN